MQDLYDRASEQGHIEQAACEQEVLEEAGRAPQQVAGWPAATVQGGAAPAIQSFPITNLHDISADEQMTPPGSPDGAQREPQHDPRREQQAAVAPMSLQVRCTVCYRPGAVSHAAAITPP